MWTVPSRVEHRAAVPLAGMLLIVKASRKVLNTALGAVNAGFPNTTDATRDD